jgi:hypothetical protein
MELEGMQTMQAIADAQNDAIKDTDRVLREVKAERASQFRKWGWGRPDGAGVEQDPVGHRHDDGHVEGDWSRFIVRYVGRAEQAIEDRDPIAWRGHMLSVAALAVAALESDDRRRLLKTDALREKES